MTKSSNIEMNIKFFIKYKFYDNYRTTHKNSDEILHKNLF